MTAGPTRTCRHVRFSAAWGAKRTSVGECERSQFMSTRPSSLFSGRPPALFIHFNPIASSASPNPMRLNSFMTNSTTCTVAMRNGRAQALSGLHQPVPVLAPVPRQPALKRAGHFRWLNEQFDATRRWEILSGAVNPNIFSDRDFASESAFRRIMRSFGNVCPNLSSWR
jgi:hypothetical protein